MVWYFAVVAIVEYWVGLCPGHLLETVRERNSSVNSAVKSTSDQVLDDDEYYSDEQYDEDLEDAELEAAVAR